jgi:Fic family protein
MIKLEIKSIKGHRYLYFRENLKVNAKSLPVALYVGRLDKIDNTTFATKLAEFTSLKLTKFEDYQVNLYKTIHLNEPSVRRIENLAYFFNEFRELYPDESDRYFQSVFVRYIQGTTAIEGNTISPEEAQELLEHDISPAGKKVSEVYEILNFVRLRDYLVTYKGDISEKLIRKINAILLENLMYTPGDYRQIQVSIEKVDYEPPPAILVPDKMQELIAWDRANGKKMHPFERAVVLHTRFELIHPFVDGNGRVGRALMNFVLERSGYPTLYLGLPERKRYLDAIKPADDGNFQTIVETLFTIYDEQHHSVVTQVMDKMKDPTKESSMLTLVKEFHRLKKKYIEES